MGNLASFWKTSWIASSLFVVGVFFLFVTVGFANDISDMGRQPRLLFVLTLIVSGMFPVLYAVSGFALRQQFWKAFFPLFALHLALLNILPRVIPSPPKSTHMGAVEIAALSHRLTFDGLSICFAVALGYACFLVVTITQGKRYFRVRAEMELATEIHRVLVPVIDQKIEGYEFYGRTVPSGEVGGDLVDVAGSKGNWVAYVADVSGHGVAPGVVMGMVKSAARMLLTSGGNSACLMARLNQVIYPLKKPNMFVTFCFIAWEGQKLRAGLAGHPPILHFSARSNSIAQLQASNLPLGIFAEGNFASCEIEAEPGDIFALYTDGFIEPENSVGEEFGLAKLAAEIREQSNQPLDAICKSLSESLARYGRQFDDQSLLLIRKL